MGDVKPPLQVQEEEKNRRSRDGNEGTRSRTGAVVEELAEADSEEEVAKEGVIEAGEQE